jgi:probable HAF family extracellular repeat protein
MKFRTWMWMSVMSLLAGLVAPVRVVAQDNLPNHHQHHQYRIIDMGTFGGPSSFVNFPYNAVPAVNSRGATVGASATPVATTSTSDFFVCGGLDGIVPNVFHGFVWQSGSVTNLGSLPPADDNCSNAASINTSGEIVGLSEKDEIDPLLGVKEFRAVRWKDGRVRDLGTFGGNDAFGLGINDRGQVVGAALNAIPDPVSILYFAIFGLTNGTQFRAFRWQDGVMHDLGTLGGPDAVAAFVNQSGQVAGFSYTNSTINPVTGVPTVHPFLWDNGRMMDLGSLGGTLAGYGNNNMLGGLNNRGEVVGTSTLAGDMTEHPFLWDRGTLKDLGTLGGDNGQATAINDAGDVVGEADLTGSQSHDAFLWKHGIMTDLGNLGLTSFAYAINSDGQVGGHSLTNDGTFRAFLWENGGPMVDLNTLIPSNSALQLLEVVAINDRGEIAGIGVPAGCSSQDEASCGHAFLLIPCDEHHPGMCEDYSMIEAPAPQTSSLARMERGTVDTASPSRDRFGRGYHLPGQLAVPRD